MNDRTSFDQARSAMMVAHERNTSLCDPFLSAFPVSGAALSILAGPSAQTTVCSSDSIAARLDELQFDLGEGPCWQALATHTPVIADSLTGHIAQAWPIFTEAVQSDRSSSSVVAMYAFPMAIGSLEIGAVDLYATVSQKFTPTQVADAASLASLAAWQVLRKILNFNESDVSADFDDSRSSRREIHQATGMVLAQLDISAADAALLIRAHAFATGRSVREVSTDVVERRLNFSPKGQP
ncbi:MAG TPA: ANTAR domain-containing protein [Glaciihabitans sp.]|nr:ANTAR domain-containing protein [Glaciihabitans sp.]